MKQRDTQNGSKSTNHRSQTLTFWTPFKESWLLSFRVRVFLKSAVRKRHDSRGPHSYKPTIYSLSLTKTSSWDSMTWVNILRIGIFHAHVLVVSKQGLLNTLHLSHNGLVTAVFSLTYENSRPLFFKEKSTMYGILLQTKSYQC